MKLLEGLQQEPITHLDLSYYCTAPAGAAVKDVVETLRQSKRNCSLILEDDKLMGIFTDRDILRKVVDRPELWEQAIDQVMTREVLTIDESATAAEAMAIMDRFHFRNVPVVRANGEVVGNFTHYSIVKFLADTFPTEIYNRAPDHTRVARRQHGG
jgi:predicted transcriptional regulator